MKNLIKSLIKYISLVPIFFFIGSGVFLSTDIMQPSVFRDIPGNALIIILAILTGSAPVTLVSNAVVSLVKMYYKGYKNSLLISAFLIGLFMASEIIYSYISIIGMFNSQVVPIEKIIGIVFIPLTFSLYFFVHLYNEQRLIHIAKNQYLEQREHLICEIKKIGNLIAHTEITDYESTK